MAIFLIILLTKMPEREKSTSYAKAIDSFIRLIANLNYREGVIAQMFYWIRNCQKTGLW